MPVHPAHRSDPFHRSAPPAHVPEHAPGTPAHSSGSGGTEGRSWPRRVLVMAPAPAVSVPDHAGGVLLAQTVRSHQAAGATVHVALPETGANRSTLETGDPLCEHLLLGSTRVLPRWRRLLQVLAHRTMGVVGAGLGPGLPLRLDFLVSPELRRLLREAEVVDLQWEQYGWLAPSVRRAAPQAVVTTMVHDVVHQRLTRELQSDSGSREHLRLQAQRAGSLLRLRHAAPRLDRAFLLSEKDQQCFQELLGPRCPPTTVLPPPLAQEQIPVADAAAGSEALFLSALFRPENLEAAQWLVREIWPMVRERVPGARLRVVGGGLPEQVASEFAAAPGVRATGFLPDLDQAYAAARVVVAPLKVGAGVKFKVVEALVRGIPVVTTPVGAEGIGEGCQWFAAVSEDAEALAEAVVEALLRPGPVRAAQEQVAEVRRHFGEASFRQRHAAALQQARAARGS